MASLIPMSFVGTAVIKQEEDWFVATCLENSVASQGKNIKEALKNLSEAIDLYFEDDYWNCCKI